MSEWDFYRFWYQVQKIFYSYHLKCSPVLEHWNFVSTLIGLDWCIVIHAIVQCFILAVSLWPRKNTNWPWLNMHCGRRSKTKVIPKKKRPRIMVNYSGRATKDCIAKHRGWSQWRTIIDQRPRIICSIIVVEQSGIQKCNNHPLWILSFWSVG